MILSDYLTKNNILVKTRSTSRWDLIRELVDNTISNGDLDSENKAEITRALIDREKSMSTGIGNGVAIPHCTTSLIDDIVVLLAITKKGIDFDSIDNLPVRLVILLLVPKNKLSQHIKTLANIAKLMSNDTLRQKLLDLKTPEAILKEIKKYEK